MILEASLWTALINTLHFSAVHVSNLKHERQNTVHM